jgi:hydrogenase maturation protein HypF
MASGLPTVLACGAWLKNAAYLSASEAGVGGQWSALHGDLSDPQACTALAASARRLLRAAQDANTPVTAIAHDLHPDFFSTRLALDLAAEHGIPAIGVQHHHAHIAAVLAEHGVTAPVVGLALDGMGLGTDGQAWGGELLYVAPSGWQRLGHLYPLALPGGDKAARAPWRMAAAALHALGRTEEIASRFTPWVGATAAQGVQRMLTTGLNCPSTSSTGRWFDAAAGLLGLSVRQSHEAEAAVALEKRATVWITAHGTPVVWHGLDTHNPALLDIRPLLAYLLDGPRDDAQDTLGATAAWFHLALADALADWAACAARQANVSTVCLGGGCFANPLLTRHVKASLQRHGLRVLLPHAHSCGDAGLALGQAWVVAQHLNTPDYIANYVYSSVGIGPITSLSKVKTAPQAFSTVSTTVFPTESQPCA